MWTEATRGRDQGKREEREGEKRTTSTRRRHLQELTEERERRFEVDAIGHEDVIWRVGDSFGYRGLSPVEDGSDHVGLERVEEDIFLDEGDEDSASVKVSW